MNLSPYPNLRKAEKIKSAFKDITERFLFSLFDSSIMTQIVERVCTVKVIIFLIASNWCSLIIVTNVLLHLIHKN